LAGSANSSGLNQTAVGAAVALAELRKIRETPKTIVSRWMTNLQVKIMKVLRVLLCAIWHF
jgi:uncharacterized protein YggL (DUF469 family)